MRTLNGKKFAYDFETYGLKFMDEGFWVRCVSFHNEQVSLSVELSDSEGNYYPGASALFDWLTKQTGLIAHNAGFEAGVLFAMTGQYVPHLCSYAMAAHVMNEGSVGQRWGLKQLGKELLSWPDWSKDVPKSAEMARLPFPKLGWYNQLDSAATWHIYQLCTEAVSGKPWEGVFHQYFDEDLAVQLELQFEAYRDGLYVDLAYTKEYVKRVEIEVEEAKQRFLQHEEVAKYVELVNAATISQMEEKLKAAPKYTQKGELASRHQGWLAKIEVAKTKCFLNLDSPVQLKALLYDFLGCEATRFTDEENTNPSTDKKALAKIPVYGKMLLEYRDVVSKLKFLLAVLENEKDGIIRISVKVPGTLSSRLSAGSLE